MNWFVTKNCDRAIFGYKNSLVGALWGINSVNGGQCFFVFFK